MLPCVRAAMRACVRACQGVAVVRACVRAEGDTPCVTTVNQPPVVLVVNVSFPSGVAVTIPWLPSIDVTLILWLAPGRVPMGSVPIAIPVEEQKPTPERHCQPPLRMTCPLTSVAHSDADSHDCTYRLSLWVVFNCLRIIIRIITRPVRVFVLFSVCHGTAVRNRRGDGAPEVGR